LWVEDMAVILTKTLDDPRTIRQSYEVGGPEILTYEQMGKKILFALQRKRLLIKVPVALMTPIIKGMEVVLPKPPATTSLLELLNVANTTSLDSVERNFGFKPRRFAEVISYLNRYPFGKALSEAIRGDA